MAEAGRRILVVDDEPALVDVVRAYLEREGFAILTAASGSQALETVQSTQLDLIVLDRMLPDLTGDQVCLRIRQESDVPIIMLTARSGADDIVEGLALGADDYLPKPFSPRVLAARVWAVLRRAQSTQPLVDHLSFNRGTLAVDFRRQEVRLDGEPVTLTRTELDILGLLVRHPGQVWTRDDLICRLRGCDYTGDDRTIDTHIKKLRAKLERDARHLEFILTVWGSGYKFGGVPDV